MRVKRTHAAALLALAVLAVPALTGCFNGQGATTYTQASMNSGNGIEARVGPIHVENATLVQGPEGSTSATLTTRIVNESASPDRLVYATINGQPADITGGGTDLGAGASVSFGFDADNWINTYALDAPVSSYVPVELGFAESGLVSMQVLIVPPVGYYAGIAPNPATAPAA